MCQVVRRRLLGQLAGLALTPLAGALAACTGERWPAGMAAIAWGRDTCARCHMVIAERRFAAEVRGGPEDEVFKFDDIGCVVFWLKNQPWADTARIWVANGVNQAAPATWLDARQARYSGGYRSPMRYGYAAHDSAPAAALDFATMREHILRKGR